MNISTDAQKFNRLTGIQPVVIADRFLTLQKGEFVIDVIALDDYCIQNFGYNIDKHGSLSEFVEMRWGKEACDFIKEHF